MTILSGKMRQALYMSRERNSPYEHPRKRDEQWDEYEYEPDYEDEEYEDPPRRRHPQRQSYRSTRSLPPQSRSRAPRSPYHPTSPPSPSRISHAKSNQR